MELTEDESYELEKNRVLKILQSREGPLEIAELVQQYKDDFKADLRVWKTRFVTIEAFMKIGCCATVGETGVSLTNKTSPANSTVVRYLTRPQFSSFFGFSDDKNKGVAYRVWRFEVDSAIQEGLHAPEVIAEQIRKSLQGEAKNKIVGFGSGTSVEQILQQLDQFYGDDGAAVGDELLSQAYKMRQQESEEVSAFASRLDNKIRQAKNHGADLLPDEEAVDRHLRLLFWQGLKENVKDKARHKKDSCKTFADLIVAARYGEKETTPFQAPRRVARQNNQASEVLGPNGSDSRPPEWLAEVCSAMAREVRQALQPFTSNPSRAENSPPRDRTPNYSRPNDQQSRQLPTCFRCGQKGHVRKGCRNTPLASSKYQQSGNDFAPLSRGSQRQ